MTYPAGVSEDKTAVDAHTNQLLRDLTQQAQEDFQSGQYQAAHDKLRQVLRVAPGDADLWRYLGLTDAQLNHFDAAIADFLKVLALRPVDTSARLNLGILYQRKGDNARAMEMYRQGLASESDDLSANQNYAILLMGAGRYREAVAPLRKMRGLNDSDLATRATLIECYLKAGMAEEGKQEVQEYLAAPNASPEDTLKLAKLLIGDKFPEAAEAILAWESQHATDLPETHDLRGALLSNRNQYGDASKEFRLAVQAAPSVPEYSADLADSLILEKQFQQAFEFLKSIQDQFGGMLEFRFKLGVVLYGSRHYQEAISLFEKIDHEQPNLDLTQYYLGNSYSENGDLDTAQTYYKKAIALNPAQASYYLALAKLLRKEGNSKTDEAILNLQKALHLDPSDAPTKEELAICYERKKDYAKAERFLQEVVAQTPAAMSAHVALSRIYYQDHKKDEGDAEKQIVLRLESQEQSAEQP